ncbi:polysaccharide biosynthesis protein [Parapedobacter tibetensis]|uniref:polysaccharide biosynthesis protein n=1 Tax=Parapedobacter tibetensis TaxID=2972951 RepID=UPI00214D40AF|nr:nucleoside-diphosphate sugar epimerase/dehydratase [Parapedobacter tibetensis]
MNYFDAANLKTAPRWVILFVDTLLLSFALVVSLLFAQNFSLTLFFQSGIIVLIFIPIAAAVLFLMRMHRGLVRYTNTTDIGRILATTALINITMGLALQVGTFPSMGVTIRKMGALLFANWAIGTLLLILMRLSIKELYHVFSGGNGHSKTKAAIYGTDHNAVMIRKALESLHEQGMRVMAFVDQSRSRLHSTIEQRKVYHVKHLPYLKEKHGITHLILAKENLGKRDKKVIIERCLRLGIKVLTVPPVNEWVFGTIQPQQVKDLQIEDLLERPPIVINNREVMKSLIGKRVLITGAAGSIGSEIARQVLAFQPEKVILCDQAESALHELLLELQEAHPADIAAPFIGDICNATRMKQLFASYLPEVVFHAAAYKHVPMMEHHPEEAVTTNVGGTQMLADLSVVYDVEKFVMISTDKAVNPTNVMGASKRIAEIYAQALDASSQNGRTRFITTRFGNVLGSNGSVIPRFRKQIEAGGPITVTHPEICRYFMTIPEAVQLVLEAGTMGKGGEIFVFDMGKPIKIVNLAKKMVLLAGLKPGKDIDIVFTGLRQGEKLYEELLNDAEQVLPTHHTKISIARVREYAYEEVMDQVSGLLAACQQQLTDDVVIQMKAIVPEYLSNNSPFQVLDRKQEPRIPLKPLLTSPY